MTIVFTLTSSTSQCICNVCLQSSQRELKSDLAISMLVVEKNDNQQYYNVTRRDHICKIVLFCVGNQPKVGTSSWAVPLNSFEILTGILLRAHICSHIWKQIERNHDINGLWRVAFPSTPTTTETGLKLSLGYMFHLVGMRWAAICVRYQGSQCYSLLSFFGFFIIQP